MAADRIKLRKYVFCVQKFSQTPYFVGCDCRIIYILQRIGFILTSLAIKEKWEIFSDSFAGSALISHQKEAVVLVKPTFMCNNIVSVIMG